MKRPKPFTLQVIQSFRDNQGILLSGAVAYYTLFSIVPLFTLILVALSNIVDKDYLVVTITQSLELIIPGQSGTVVDQVTLFLNHQHTAGWLIGLLLLFTSSFAFSVLENAMSVIFFHRVAIRRRHFMISAIIPYLYILALGLGFLIVTIIATALQAVSNADLELLGRHLPLGGLIHVVFYLIGLGGEILILTSIYIVMPVGNLSWRKALVGGVSAGLLWELTRHVMVWYFSTLSLISLIYGSLASLIFILVGLEVASLILLLGAQIIAEYERLDTDDYPTSTPKPMRLD